MVRKSNEEVYVLLTRAMGASGGPERNPITARVLERIDAQIQARAERLASLAARVELAERNLERKRSHGRAAALDADCHVAAARDMLERAR